MMIETLFATSSDGCHIAFDVIGEGLPIMLLHGGGHTRRNWHEAGYVAKLKDNFKVISVDLRGNGESDTPKTQAHYTTDRFCQDLLAIADACQVKTFSIWGYSYGGNIGRYLAATSDRVTKIIIIGIPFGLGASGEFRDKLRRYCDRWTPIVQAQIEGSLEWNSLTPDDQEYLRRVDVSLKLARYNAILNWSIIEPEDIRCPGLWLVGSENAAAMASIRAYGERVTSSTVQVQLIEGLDHFQEFTEIDRVYPVLVAFTQS